MARITENAPEDVPSKARHHKHLCGLDGDRCAQASPGCGYIWQHTDPKFKLRESDLDEADRRYRLDHECPRCGKHETWKFWSTWLMATINSREIISRLIENGGYYSKEDTDSPDNPRAEKIVEYTTVEGKRVWGVSFNGEGDINRYMEATDYVRDPIVIWTPQDGLILEPSQEGERDRRDRRQQVKDAMGNGEQIVDDLMAALGLTIESKESAQQKAKRLNNQGYNATVFEMPDNPSQELMACYTMLALADVEKATALMKMWNMASKLMNPKMNAILYAHLMEFTNAFVKVGVEMKEDFGIPDAYERNRKILIGYNEMALQFFDAAWKVQEAKREQRK